MTTKTKKPNMKDETEDYFFEQGRASILQDVEKLIDKLHYMDGQMVVPEKELKQSLSQLHNQTDKAKAVDNAKVEQTKAKTQMGSEWSDSQARKQELTSEALRDELSDNPAPCKRCLNCGKITLTGKSGLCFRCFVRFKEESKPQPKETK